ncbi:MAG: hypothetical protein GY928_20895 [Colwellia sp.]|nr:hypothetical protein [Colwellia sp.]
MKTKQDILTKTIELPLISTASVWDIHNINLFSVARNKKSNLHKELVALKKQGYKLVSILVGARGWTQHSPTDLLIYKGRPESDNVLYNHAAEFDLTTY